MSGPLEGNNLIDLTCTESHNRGAKGCGIWAFVEEKTQVYQGKFMFDSARSIALVLCFIISGSIVMGCAERTNHSPLPSISDDAKASLKARVNCSTARADIAILEEERASVGKRILSGVRSVLPFAAVAGILMGDYRDRVEVATGQYNADIEHKIAEIKQACF